MFPSPLFNLLGLKNTSYVNWPLMPSITHLMWFSIQDGKGKEHLCSVQFLNEQDTVSTAVNWCLIVTQYVAPPIEHYAVEVLLCCSVFNISFIFCLFLSKTRCYLWPRAYRGLWDVTKESQHILKQSFRAQTVCSCLNHRLLRSLLCCAFLYI